MTNYITNDKLEELIKEQEYTVAVDAEEIANKDLNPNNKYIQQRIDILSSLKELKQRREFDEKDLEYQQVAALLCMRIDLCVDVAKMSGTTATEIATSLKEFKDKMVANKEARENCYAANQIIWNLVYQQEEKD